MAGSLMRVVHGQSVNRHFQLSIEGLGYNGNGIVRPTLCLAVTSHGKDNVDVIVSRISLRLMCLGLA